LHSHNTFVLPWTFSQMLMTLLPSSGRLWWRRIVDGLLGDDHRTHPTRAIVLLVTVVAVIARFVALEASPPGFAEDEAAISAQIICVRETGADATGTRWPLFVSVLGGGHTNAPYLYSGLLWTAAVGDSIASFRALAALFGAFTVAGVWFLGLVLWEDRQAAGLCALCAAISPWAFQLSRVAWDPAIAPCLLTWAIALFLYQGRRPYLAAALAGLLSALALYSYPPLRVQAVLVLPAVLALSWWRRTVSPEEWLRRIVTSAAVGGVVLVPLLHATIAGTINGRANTLGIWNRDYMARVGGFSVANVLKVFLANLRSHFDSSYLFLTGDPNLRHATGRAGQWSWLEILAALVLPFLFVRRVLSGREKAVLVFASVSYVAGVSAAALTWESNPHALRSVGAYPFLALAAGGVLYCWSRIAPKGRALVPVVAVLFFSWFAVDYFGPYSRRAEPWFRKPSGVAGGTTLESVVSRRSRYPKLSMLYYQLADGSRRCGRGNVSPTAPAP
jgi:hypothetical protein